MQNYVFDWGKHNMYALCVITNILVEFLNQIKQKS
jgi:hypothetical protein